MRQILSALGVLALLISALPVQANSDTEIDSLSRLDTEKLLQLKSDLEQGAARARQIEASLAAAEVRALIDLQIEQAKWRIVGTYLDRSTRLIDALDNVLLVAEVAGALGEAIDLVFSAVSNPIQTGGQVLESAATLFQVGVNGVQLAAQEVTKMPVPSLSTAPIILADSVAVRVKSFIAAGGRLESQTIRDCLGIGTLPVAPGQVEQGVRERCGTLPYGRAEPDWKRLEDLIEARRSRGRLAAEMGHFAAAFERQLFSIDGIVANREGGPLKSHYLCRPYPKFLPLTVPRHLAAEAFTAKALGMPQEVDYTLELIFWGGTTEIVTDPLSIQWTGLENFAIDKGKLSSSLATGRIERLEVHYPYKILEGSRRPQWNDYSVGSAQNVHVWAFDDLWVNPAGDEKTLEKINLFVDDIRRPPKMQIIARFTDSHSEDTRSVAHQIKTSVAPSGLAATRFDTPQNFWEIPWLYVTGKEVGSGSLELDSGLGKKIEIDLDVFSFSQSAAEGETDVDGNILVEKTMGAAAEFHLHVNGPLLRNANDPDKTDDYRVVWSLESDGAAPHPFGEPVEESGPVFADGKNTYSVSYLVPETRSEDPLGYTVTGRFWEKDTLLREVHFGLKALPPARAVDDPDGDPGGDPGGDPDQDPPPVDELGNLPAGHKLVLLVLLPPDAEVIIGEPTTVAAFPMVVPLDFPDLIPLNPRDFERAGPELEQFFIRGEEGRFLEAFRALWTLEPGLGIVHQAESPFFIDPVGIWHSPNGLLPQTWPGSIAATLVEPSPEPQPEPPPSPVATPLVLDFGDVPGGTTAELAVVVRNPDTSAVTLAGLGSSAEAFTVLEPTPPVAINPGDSLGVRVLFAAPARLNAVQRGVLRLATSNGNLAVPLSGRGTRVGLAVDPAVLDFGGVKVGAEARLSVEITNPGNLPLQVTGLAEAHRAFALEPDSVTVQGGQSQTVVLRFSPPARGVYRAELPLQSNATALALKVSGAGLVDPFTVVGTTPPSGSVGLPTRSEIRVEFSKAVGLAGARPHLDYRFTPQVTAHEVAVDGNAVVFSLSLQNQRQYRLLIQGGQAADGSPLARPLELLFSTAASVVPLGAVAGAVRVSDSSDPSGNTVILIDAGGQVVATARVDTDGNYSTDDVAAGVYRLFLRRIDGGAGVDLGSVEVLEGITVTAAEAAIGDPAEHPDASQTPIQIDADIQVPQTLDADGGGYAVLPVELGAVEGLTGFVVRLAFDPQTASLVETLSDNGQTANALYANEGAPLFLTQILEAGRVEFGGSILAPTEATAVDGGGLLAAWRLLAVGPSFEVVVEQVVLRTLAGSDTLEVQRSVSVVVGQGCGTADFDCDTDVDLDDFFSFVEAFGRAALAQDRQFDLNDDGAIDLLDFFVFTDRFATGNGSTAKLMALAGPLLGVPLDFTLEPGYPNPFNGQTTIVYALPVGSELRLDIYNVAGQRVRRLAQGHRNAGRYSSVWDGRDAAGRPLGNGLYFVRLETEAFSQVRKLMLLE